MPETLDIQSHRGAYSVHYHADVRACLAAALNDECHVIADQRVLEIYSADIEPMLDSSRLVVVEASEAAKTIDAMIPVMEQLIENGFRRDQRILAIGGGVVQDITCFIASVMMRGVTWRYVPTTLLAQADSCIGSKSSVNLKVGKNILGTFYPPEVIHVAARFLKTLPLDEIRSGIGEIIKVHAIDGRESYDYLSTRFDRIEEDDVLMEEFISRALLVKKRYIEVDEFDRGPRNIFNLGHSFGHAIETATDYSVPHGIAVTLGMKIAVDFAVALGHTPEETRRRMHPMLRKNARDYLAANIDPMKVFNAMARDKKNTKDGYRIIIPVGDDAKITAISVAPDAKFISTLQASIKSLN